MPEFDQEQCKDQVNTTECNDQQKNKPQNENLDNTSQLINISSAQSGTSPISSASSVTKDQVNKHLQEDRQHLQTKILPKMHTSLDPITQNTAKFLAPELDPDPEKKS